MAIIPERILQHVIVQGIKGVRRDPKVLASLFQDLTDGEYDQIQKFILNTSIGVYVNFPRKEPDPPMVVLTLQNEEEAETFLGDFMGDSINYDVSPSPLVHDTGIGTASTSTPQGLPNVVYGGVRVLGSTGTTVLVDPYQTLDWTEFLNESVVVPLRVYVVGGTGAGQSGIVSRLRSSSFEVQTAFSTPLDETSILDIREYESPTNSIGEPRRVYDESATVSRLGANYLSRYRLDVVASSQEQVIYLHFVLKSLFFLSKTFLEGHGIQALKITSSDLSPRTDFIPDELFHRTMTLTFQAPFSVLKVEDAFEKIILCIEPGDVLNNEAGEDYLISEIILNP